MSPRVKYSLAYLDRAKLPDIIRTVRKHVQRLRTQPPSTKTRLLSSYKLLTKALDDVLFTAEVTSEQKHKDTFPDEWKDRLEAANAALARLGSHPDIDVVRGAVELMNDFAEFNGNRVHPSEILRDIRRTLKVPTD